MLLLAELLCNLSLGNSSRRVQISVVIKTKALLSQITEILVLLFNQELF